jgi:hypothetical protein
VEGFLEKDPIYRLTSTHAINSPYFSDVRNNKIHFKIPDELKQNQEKWGEKYQNPILNFSEEKNVCFLNCNLTNNHQQQQQKEIYEKLQIMTNDRKKCLNLYSTEKIKSSRLEQQITQLNNEKFQAINIQRELKEQLNNATIFNEVIEKELINVREKSEKTQINLAAQKNETFKYQGIVNHLQEELKQLKVTYEAAITDRKNIEQLFFNAQEKMKVMEEQLLNEDLEKEKYQNILEELYNISPTIQNPEAPKSNILENLVKELEITPDISTTNQETIVKCEVVFKTQLPSEKPFICFVCNKEFNQRSDLQRHIEEIHEQNDKRFECNLCDRKFKVLRYLKDHINQVHFKNKIYYCKICNKRFITKSLRDNHRRKCNK